MVACSIQYYQAGFDTGLGRGWGVWSSSPNLSIRPAIVIKCKKIDSKINVCDNKMATTNGLGKCINIIRGLLKAYINASSKMLYSLLKVLNYMYLIPFHQRSCPQ